MKVFHLAIIPLVVALTSTPSFAQKAKAIGKCMKPDCASMQKYCEESKAAGNSGTNCETAGKQCLDGKGRTWVGTTPDGKKWSCTFQ